MKKRLLFIDYDFHKKTISTNFIIDILEEIYDVVEVRTDLIGQINDLERYNQLKNEAEVLVFCQVWPRIDEEDIIQKRKIVYFPMYDGVKDLSDDIWCELKNVLIVSFSNTLYRKLSRLKLDVKYIQYFPKPIQFLEYGDDNSAFFWQRTNRIHINNLTPRIPKQFINKYHIHMAIDPGYYFVEPMENEGIEYSFSDWYDNKQDLYDEMEKSAFYIAPRSSEGIGMSFLNAMAMGRCVIAQNEATMNEYIQNGITGILYEANSREDILSNINVRDVQKNVLEYIRRGYLTWTSKKKDILSWIEAYNGYTSNVPVEGGIYEVFQSSVQNKYYEYYNIYDKWVYLLNKKIQISSFFINENIGKIAIYGYGNFAKRLAEALLPTGIEVSYYVDRNVGFAEDGKKIYSINEINDKVDDVEIYVVTAVHYYDEIQMELMRVTNKRIVSLNFVINYLLDGSNGK